MQNIVIICVKSFIAIGRETTDPETTRTSTRTTFMATEDPFPGLKIPTTKHEIRDNGACNADKFTHLTYLLRPHWQLGTHWISVILIWQSGSCACVFVRKADTLNTN